jgi:meso-butanediol dehydrogenase/(S,S)-butanediol dehydrogenase/diacetyl reductase
MGRYANKVVLVTGAASGIGRATARRLASEGATVVIGDINEAGLKAVADEIRATAVPFNAGKAASCRDFINAAVEKHGRIDMLCNIAGVMDWAPLDQFGDDRWDRLVSINLSSVFHLSKAAIPHLLKTKGNIVNLASAAGLVGIAYTAGYCAVKHGVVGLTKSMAIEFAAKGVRVNCICPTGVKTAMMDNLAFPENVDMSLLMRNNSKMGEGEMIEAEDVAAAVLYLGTEDARYITGVALPVDGAQTAG